ncbi:MAG: VCBS repeat-containing protein [Planctomycetota bacterium]
MATAANMLAAAGYGTGSSIQARADSIYLQITGNWSIQTPGWPDTAIKWWLSSGHNNWPTNPYIWVGVRGNRDINIPWSSSNVPQIIGNKIRKCEYAGVAFFWASYNIGHVTPVWGDEGRTAENYDWPIQNNPTKIIMSDSDLGDGQDGLPDLQTYTYTYTTVSGKKAWTLNYGGPGGLDPWIRCISTLARSTIDPQTTYTRRQRIIGSYKVTKPGIIPDATKLHYVVGPDSGTLLLYETYIDWDTNSVPAIQENIGTPKVLTVDWDLSDNPVPYGASVTITTEIGSGDGGGIWYKNVGFPGIYTNFPSFGIDCLHNQLGSNPFEPNDPNMTGGYIYGAMDVTDGDGNDGEFRWVKEYDYDQDPEWHNVIVSPHFEATEVYQISNLRFGHAYGLPDDVCDIWNFSEWWTVFPGPYELIPAGPPQEFELNWAGMGLIPYPISNNYQGTEVPPPRSFQNEQNLQGVWHSDSAWGDFDNDGDLDLVICGKYPYLGPWTWVTLTYENQGGTLVQKAQANLTGISNESGGGLAWGDYDGDGDLDLAMAGLTDASTRIARIYKNDGTGTLTNDTNQVLVGVSNATIAWGDYDNDGDLDLVVIGYDGTEPNSILYKNDPLGTLTADSATSLTGLHTGSADWADIDGDADLDLLLTGHDGATQQAIFYINNPVGTLTDDGPHGLNGVNYSDVAFGDYDNDGDMDLAITGSDGAGSQKSLIYENDGSGVFTDTSAGLTNVYRSSVAWGDYDNDGDLDLVLCGYDGGSLHTRFYENTGSGFSLDYTLTGVREGSVNFADVNDDGDLDFFMTGADWSTTYARLYSNKGGLSNISPSAPNSLTCTPDDVNGGILLEWSGTEDNETPLAGLYYAVRVGTEPGENDILSGTYSTPLMGNHGQATQLFLNVPIDTYYWSVKTIDSGFKASDWASEQVCHYCPGDIDLDCDVEFLDFAVMANAWLTELAQMDQNYNELCDISNPPDGVIDAKDLDVLSENWLLNR